MNDRDFIKRWEALRLVAYPDGGGVWTIGYGHTGPDVVKGLVITTNTADDFLDEDLNDSREAVEKYVRVQITDSMRAALVSFTFNLGAGALQKSTLLKRVNAKDWANAANELLRWNKDQDPKTGKLVVVPGLTNRRKAERALFLSELPLFDTPKEAPMLPAFVLPLLSTITSSLPELARTLAQPNVAARNAEAVNKVVEIIVETTQSPNLQTAVEKIQSDVAVADVVDEQLRMSRAEIMDIMERENKMTQENISSAREFNKSEDVLFGRIKFVHILSSAIMVVCLTGVLLILSVSDSETERSIALQLLVVGFTGVLGYWIGSSQGSDKKTDMLKK